MKWKIFFACICLSLGFFIGYGVVRFLSHYEKNDRMCIKVIEKSIFEYPDAAAKLSPSYQKYGDRVLYLYHKNSSEFDFVFESHDPKVASVTFHNIDLSLFLPKIPEWIKGNKSLESISVKERESIRQQISFYPNTITLSIEGGDGFEKENVCSADLCRNSLNAGFWEIMLYSHDKTLLYHGWFSLPLGHYKEQFEKINGCSYWKYCLLLEGKATLAGKIAELSKTRKVIDKKSALFLDFSDEKILAAAEQQDKSRIMNAKNVFFWKDFSQFSHSLQFAAFVPPGVYSMKKKWKNEFDRFYKLESISIKKTQLSHENQESDEIELSFLNEEKNHKTRLILGGIDLSEIPSQSTETYFKGYFVTMGIGNPSVFQSYEKLKETACHEKTDYCLLVDENNHWIDPHKAAIEGIILHKDLQNPQLMHLYLLSYERISLIAHYAVMVH